MAKNYYRKPIPKTQKEISKDLQTPFDATQGNPNDSLEGGQFPPDNQANIPFNRSTKMSFKGDTTKPFSVGIKDIDESIMYYFQNVIRPSVIQNGERIAVPIIYGSPERWKSIQKDAYYRDKKGAIMLPILVLKRDTITKDRSVANKLDANQPNLYGVFSKQFSSKNFYSNFATLNNRVPVETFHAVAQPDYVTMEYSCLVQTYYMEQLNKIIEACEYGSDAYWGNPERFMFRSFIDSFTTATELTTGKDRLVTGTFNIRLRGYLIPDTIQKDLNSTKKYNSKAKVTIGMETVSNIETAGVPTQNPTTDHRSRS